MEGGPYGRPGDRGPPEGDCDRGTKRASMDREMRMFGVFSLLDLDVFPLYMAQELFTVLPTKFPRRDSWPQRPHKGPLMHCGQRSTPVPPPSDPFLSRSRTCGMATTMTTSDETVGPGLPSFRWSRVPSRG